MKTGYVYDKGARDKNEDALLYRETLFKKGTLALCCVCDGMGGMDEGERASSICISRIEDFYDHVLVPFILSDPKPQSLKKFIDSKVCSLFCSLNSELFSIMRKEKVNLGSTVSLLIIFKDHFRIYHLGDSRIYRIDKKMPFIKAMRLMTKDDAKEGKLIRCMGLNKDWKPLIRSGRMGDGAFIICSDGFYKRADDKIIEQCLMLSSLSSDAAITKRLKEIKDMCIKRGEKDNISAFVVRKGGENE